MTQTFWSVCHFATLASRTRSTVWTACLLVALAGCRGETVEVRVGLLLDSSTRFEVTINAVRQAVAALDEDELVLAGTPHRIVRSPRAPASL
jgi:hypothetical protein